MSNLVLTLEFLVSQGAGSLCVQFALPASTPTPRIGSSLVPIYQAFLPRPRLFHKFKQSPTPAVPHSEPFLPPVNALALSLGDGLGFLAIVNRLYCPPPSHRSSFHEHFRRHSSLLFTPSPSISLCNLHTPKNRVPPFFPRR